MTDTQSDSVTDMPRSREACASKNPASAVVEYRHAFDTTYCRKTLCLYYIKHKMV